MRGVRNGTYLRILALLEEYGPMTMQDVSQHIDGGKKGVSILLCRLRKPTLTRKKLVRIAAYVYDQEGKDGQMKRYPRPVYELGDGPDVKKPPRDRKGANRRYRINTKQRMVSSVFDLGMTQVQIREKQAAVRRSQDL